MAKNNALPLLVGLAALGAVLFMANEAKADEPGPNWDTPSRGGKRGKGPGGSPRAKGENGDLPTWGTPPPGASYLVPEDWDPIRGLWISPDCQMVVEAPGWFCGSSGAGEAEVANAPGGFVCEAVEEQTLIDTMAIPNNGASGYIASMVLAGYQPEEIAIAIVAETSPLCADVSVDQWGAGLIAWYESLLARVIEMWEEERGVIFFGGEAEA